MKKLYQYQILLGSFLLVFFLFTNDSYAQKPNVEIPITDIPILLDGELDEVWDEVDPNPIENNVTGADNIDVAFWKACWNINGIFIVLVVEDGSFQPSEVTGLESWQSDKGEIYFDVNEVLEDGLGANQLIASGHFQLAPTFVLAEDGNEQTGVGDYLGCSFAHKVTGNSYVFEYFVSFSVFDNAPDFDQTRTIGFDVSVIDRDEGGDAENRVTWANEEEAGASTSSWNTMDNCGTIDLSDENSIGTSIPNIPVGPSKVNAFISNDILNLKGVRGIVRVYDITGNLVLIAPDYSTTVNVSALNPGLYIIKANNLSAKVMK